MAYIPPFGGGHFNATISGNTSGAGALVSSGTLTLAGGNNITLSQAGNAVTISGGAAGGLNSLGMSNLGNTSGTTGVVSGSALQYYLAGGNNITLNQSLNGSSGTLSIAGANQTNQTLGLYGSGANTIGQSSSSTFDARSVNYSGLGAVSLGFSGSTMQISAPIQSAQTQSLVQAMYDGVNSITTGTVRLSNSNGVSFGVNGQTLTASVNAQTNQTLGLHATGANTIGQSSSSTFDARSVNYSGLGAVSLGFSGSTMQISAPIQSAQTQSNIQAIYDGVNSITTGTIRLSNSNGVSFGVNGQTLTASVNAQTNQTLGMYASGANTIGQSSSSTLDARSLNYSGQGAVSLGFSGSTMQISAPIQSAQTQSNIQAIYDGVNSITTGTIRLSNSNGVSFGVNGQTLTASVNAQTNQTLGLYGSGANTIGQSSSSTFDARSVNYSGLGAVSVGFSGSTMQISAPIQSAQTQNMVSFGGSTGNIVVSNSNNVTFGGNASVVTASASFNQTNQTLGMYATGNTTQNSSTTFDARSLTFNGLGNVSIGYSNGSVQISGAGGGGGVALAATNTTFTSGTVDLITAGGAITISSSSAGGGGQSINFAVPQTSSMSGTGAVSVSTNGSTVYVGAPVPGTISNWEPMPINMGSLSNTQLGNGSLYFFELTPGANVSATQLMHLISVSASSSSNSSWAGNITIMAGIYTASTQSTLNLITQSSGSATYAFTNTSSNSYNSLTGLRGLTIPMTANMSAGNYWLGILSRTASVNTNWVSLSNMAFTGLSQSYNGVLGQAANATQGIQEAVGFMSASTSVLPTTAAMSQMTQSNLRANAYPYVIFNNIAW